jgi:flavin reductase (DIM6/NTAB) family NADH-FMN oxidoreductase RutF
MASWGTLSASGDGPGRSARRALRSGEREHEFAVRPEWVVDIPRAVALVPGVTAVMTSAFEHKRGGVLVHRLMKCADEPACIAVAVPKGQRLATLIRDSHAFALSIMERTTKLMLKKFAADEEGDPFDTFELRTMATGSPMLVRSVAVIDCEVMRHFDLEADHELYVGHVLAAKVFDAARSVVVPGGEVPVTQFEEARAGEHPHERRGTRPLRLGDDGGTRGKRSHADDHERRGGAGDVGSALDGRIPASPK